MRQNYRESPKSNVNNLAVLFTMRKKIGSEE